MASKYQLITAIYEEVCKEVVRDKESWKEFLRTAGFNYKLRFDEQLLAYAQRPDVTAVLEIEKWNNNIYEGKEYSEYLQIVRCIDERFMF